MPVSVKSAEGCYLIAEDGIRYLDLTSNRENQPFGYSLSNPDLHLYDSDLFHSCESKNLEEDLKAVTDLEKAYFFSSQAEACSFSKS